ncbi:MAG: aconitate hydratase [bacterium]
MNIVEKLVKSHIVSGNMEPGKEIGISIDQTLTQDATGTLVYLSWEALGFDTIRTKTSVSYIDHNTLQVGFENADDHRYLQSVAAKYGIYFSPPGNGICHQVHLERFGKPGMTLLGSDSHTPTAGALGMLAIGAGGLDVTLALAGEPFYTNYPEIVKINLNGKLHNLVSSKDIILELLRRIGVKGGVGKIFEYGGNALKWLTVPERATITNMGAELGLTSSVFPSDSLTKEFLKMQNRLKDYKNLQADKDAYYSKVMEIDLNEVEPMIAKPHSPDNVVKVKDLEGQKVNQIAIGSCTNSSYKDLMTVASILEGKRISKDVDLVISPGSRQVLDLITRNGALHTIIQSGARILETACGPCIGMGQAPCSGGVSLRTFNRNFKGRSGTEDAQVFLVSPETASVSALKGVITDPRSIKRRISVIMPKKINYDDNLIIPPIKNRSKVNIIRGRNIKPLVLPKALETNLDLRVLIITGDNISTDDILPGGARILPLRSNIPAISEYVFSKVDSHFAERAKRYKNGVIIAGENYGQGSSREHAAIAPMYLGVRMVIAKSFARIHRQNLINYGIIPAVFQNKDSYNSVSLEDQMSVTGIRSIIEADALCEITNKTKDIRFSVYLNLSAREREVLLAGGLLNFVKIKK